MQRVGTYTGAFWVAMMIAASLAHAVTFSSRPNDAINDLSSISDTIDTTSDFTTETILSVYIDINISHTYAGDLTLDLTSPSGTQLQILARPGGTHPDETSGLPYGYNADLDRRNRITFIDGAGTSAEDLGQGGGTIAVGSYYPDADGWSQDISSFAGFAGEIAAGDWVLRVGDYAAGDTGRFVRWQLHIEAVPEPSTNLMMVVGLIGLARAGNRTPSPRS